MYRTRTYVGNARGSVESHIKLSILDHHTPDKSSTSTSLYTDQTEQVTKRVYVHSRVHL